MARKIFVLSIYLDAKGFLDFNADFQRIDRIEPKPFTKKSFIDLYFIRGHVFQIQRLDNEMPDTIFKFSQALLPPLTARPDTHLADGLPPKV